MPRPTAIRSILPDVIMTATLRSERRERGLCVDCGAVLGTGRVDSFCAGCANAIRVSDPSLYRYITEQHAANIR